MALPNSFFFRLRALPDVNPTPKLISPLLHSTDCFVLIQNGIGIHADLQAARLDAAIISSCAWIDATTVDGGRSVVQSGPVREKNSRDAAGFPCGLSPNLILGQVDFWAASQPCRLVRRRADGGRRGCPIAAAIPRAPRRWGSR